MSDPTTVRRRRVAVWAAVATLAALVAPPLRGADAELERLLAASDPFVAAPREMRVALRFSVGTSDVQVPIELWRKGDALALVRFLAPKDVGKFVVRRDGAFYFLSPNAKAPVKLAPALAPAGGAALDDLLAVRPSRDYVITSSEATGELVTFDLTAKPGVPGAPHVRWGVDRGARRPVRAEFRDADNRVIRLVEFKAWHPTRRLEPARIVAKDVARGGRPLEVEFVALEARAVADALFDLSDGAARSQLPPPAVATPVVRP
jgi:hypothetical protein